MAIAAVAAVLVAVVVPVTNNKNSSRPTEEAGELRESVNLYNRSLYKIHILYSGNLAILEREN